MRISDWSSDVCSSDLSADPADPHRSQPGPGRGAHDEAFRRRLRLDPDAHRAPEQERLGGGPALALPPLRHQCPDGRMRYGRRLRSEEHTSELQSLMRNSYAVFCLKKQYK